MANTAGAKKRNRQAIVRTLRNKSTLNKVRTFIRKLEDAAKLGNKESLPKLFVEAQSEISKAAQKGILPKNTASRKIARLNKLLSA